jgi:hypothetical protein
MFTRRKFAYFFAVLVALVGCSSTYYAALEKIGIPKRNLMVSRVKSAQASQEEAKEQFKSALEQFSAVVEVKDTQLKSRYDNLNAELQRAETKASAVRSRVASVADVSDALFAEWEAELEQYTNKKLRLSSERTLKNTKDKYARMMAAMRRAESKLDPVLQPLRENVLFLKHNLNAEAIGSLDVELAGVEDGVQLLLRDLERSIAESKLFIEELERAA